MLQSGKLFTVNYLLPVSPRYPGLEEVTAALSSVTGLSVFVTGLIIAGVAHLLFVSVLYLLFREVSGSHRVGGVAVLYYASNPLFTSFDSMFVYQTLALAFFALTLLTAWRLPRGRRMASGRAGSSGRADHPRDGDHSPRDQLRARGHADAHLPGRPGQRQPARRGWTALLAAASALAVAAWLVLRRPADLVLPAALRAGTLHSLQALLAAARQRAAAPVGPLGNQAPVRVRGRWSCRPCCRWAGGVWRRTAASPGPSPWRSRLSAGTRSSSSGSPWPTARAGRTRVHLRLRARRLYGGPGGGPAHRDRGSLEGATPPPRCWSRCCC